jgi:hypothetical protein
VSSIWNPDGRQVAGAVEERQLLRVAPIGLDPLARLTWDHRGCRHGALMSERCQLAMDAVPTPTCFIAEVELTMLEEPLPFFFMTGIPAVIVAAVVSLIAHFAVGAAKSLITIRSWWASGFEMTWIGALEGVVTYVIGIGLGTLGGG